MNFNQRFTFCPKCACSLEKKGKDFQCIDCEFMFWQNSKPTVTASIMKNGKILLGKRTINPYKGCWDLPGGFLEDGEHPEKGLKREMREELGVEIKIKKFIGLFIDKFKDQDNWYNALCIHYLCEITKGKPEPLEEASELRWFHVRDLPKKISFNSNRKVLSLLKK